mmetsp:Transcript_42421/g.101451  ORF Transcript_42421/g.101451 Transcript_42421/m.101451 type:complete len:919 (-) Transcript_42421:116-2872(-)
MAPKRKAAAKAPAEEPAVKEAKTEEPAKEPKEEPAVAKEAEAEEPKEKEKDDKKDTRAQIKEAVCFHSIDTTLNVVPTTDGRVLMAMSDGGMQFLIAGARANVGVKSGRYYYEVKVIEALTPMEGRNNAGRGRVPMPRQLVRIGFSVAGSSLILGDGSDGCVCFDSEGFYFAEKKRTPASTRFGRDQAIGVLLNLDQASPNANTVSIFVNGQRTSEPMPLPEKLKGQPLFPHVSYRNVSLQVNFGPCPVTPLPFKCRTLQEAAAADVKEVKAEKPKDGKFEVLFPVAFPDEGTFDWLDDFLEKHPNYVEISDRSIQDWAVKSGIWKPRTNSWKHSNDKPEFNFGIQYMDDLSIQRCLSAITAVVPRNYVVMEVKQNLTSADRKANLKRFVAPCYRKVAHVMMGEPTAEYKAYIQKKILDDKQSKAEVDVKLQRLEKERKRAIAVRQKELAEQNKAALEALGERPVEAELGEEKKEEPLEEADGDKLDEPMPQVELTEEEKKLIFRPPTVSDLTSNDLNSAFGKFCIPEASEGFDEIRYEWQDEATSKAYLKKWVLERKLTSRIEDLQPGEGFRSKLAEFQRSLQDWQNLQKDYKEGKAAYGEELRAAEGMAHVDEEMDIKKMDIEIADVVNICDMGNGEPLFSNFKFEDWALLTLRFELHLLQSAFREDVDDAERLGVHENHLLFYYSRYYRKQLNPRAFGKDTPQEVVGLVKDAVKMSPDTKVLVSVLPNEPKGMGEFVKLQEESRRKRQQRIEAGDETARLNFALLQQQQEPQWPPEVPPTVPATFAPPPPAVKGGGKEQQWWPEPAPLPQPPPPLSKGGGKEQQWRPEPALLPQPPPPQSKGQGKDMGGCWPAPAPAPRYPKGSGKDLGPGPVGGPPGDIPGAGPRLVPPPRPQGSRRLPRAPWRAAPSTWPWTG